MFPVTSVIIELTVVCLGKMRLCETSEINLPDKTVQSANILIIEVFSCLHYLRTMSLKCLSEY